MPRLPSPVMEAIEFHTGIDDPVGFAVRLLRKAYRQRVRVLVTATAPVLDQISRQLWLAHEREFIAHVRVGCCLPGQAARTSLWLATAVAEVEHEPEVVINVGAAAPADVGRLQRLIEGVAADAEGAAEGRQRWRQYKAAGFGVTHLNATPSA